MLCFLTTNGHHPIRIPFRTYIYDALTLLFPVSSQDPYNKVKISKSIGNVSYMLHRILCCLNLFSSKRKKSIFAVVSAKQTLCVYTNTTHNRGGVHNIYLFTNAKRWKLQQLNTKSLHINMCNIQSIERVNRFRMVFIFLAFN